MEITFESLGLSQAMLKALEKKGYGYPTTIQAEKTRTGKNLRRPCSCCIRVCP